MNKKDMHKYIEHIKVIEKTDCRDEYYDIGLVLIFRDSFLKKNKHLKKFNIIAYGDSITEVRKNNRRIGLELCLMDFKERRTQSIKKIK